MIESQSYRSGNHNSLHISFSQIWSCFINGDHAKALAIWVSSSRYLRRFSQHTTFFKKCICLGCKRNTLKHRHALVVYVVCCWLLVEASKQGGNPSMWQGKTLKNTWKRKLKKGLLLVDYTVKTPQVTSRQGSLSLFREEKTTVTAF